MARDRRLPSTPSTPSTLMVLVALAPSLHCGWGWGWGDAAVKCISLKLYWNPESLSALPLSTCELKHHVTWMESRGRERG